MLLPIPRSLHALVTGAALALAGAAPASASLDTLIAVHRGEAAPPVQHLLGDEPAGHGWTTVALRTASARPDGNCPPLLRHTFTPIQGGMPVSLCQFEGKVLLVVNTASECGFTYQYEGLEALYRRYRDRGLVVIGFPSNDFGGQEPGTNRQIAEFCRTKYGVQFPMFEKQTVTRLADNALYADLAAKTGLKPRWNFHKYVIDRQGDRVHSFASDVEPASRALVDLIERLLAQPPPGQRS